MVASGTCLEVEPSRPGPTLARPLHGLPEPLFPYLSQHSYNTPILKNCRRAWRRRVLTAALYRHLAKRRPITTSPNSHDKPRGGGSIPSRDETERIQRARPGTRSRAAGLGLSAPAFEKHARGRPALPTCLSRAARDPPSSSHSQPHSGSRFSSRSQGGQWQPLLPGPATAGVPAPALRHPHVCLHGFRGLRVPAARFSAGGPQLSFPSREGNNDNDHYNDYESTG